MKLFQGDCVVAFESRVRSPTGDEDKAMSNRKPKKPAAKAGTVSQRQLRASEMIRHALVEVMRENEIRDPALIGVSVTVTEVRLSPDLKHATCFVEPLGAGVDTAPVAGHIDEIIKALNLHAKFLRGALGRHIDMRFTPDLRFRHDESFAAAERLNRLLDDPRVRADVYVSPFEDDDKEDGQP